jgi:hypothetical protein
MRKLGILLGFIALYQLIFYLVIFEGGAFVDAFKMLLGWLITIASGL